LQLAIVKSCRVTFCTKLGLDGTSDEEEEN